jgi:hypothetical protein
VRLARIGGGAPRDVNLKVDLPRRFRFASLQIQGGSSSGLFDCFEEFGPCSSGVGKVTSFGELIDSLEDAPKGNDLTATLTTNTDAHRSATARLDGVVSGFRFLFLRANRR